MYSFLYSVLYSASCCLYKHVSCIMYLVHCVLYPYVVSCRVYKCILFSCTLYFVFLYSIDSCSLCYVSCSFLSFFCILYREFFLLCSKYIFCRPIRCILHHEYLILYPVSCIAHDVSRTQYFCVYHLSFILCHVQYVHICKKFPSV
jgi:hypothetical protein